MIKDQKELFIETDLLEGNVNRMCVTKDEKELVNMRDWAIKRIERIFEYRSLEIFKNT